MMSNSATRTGFSRAARIVLPVLVTGGIGIASGIGYASITAAQPPVASTVAPASSHTTTTKRLPVHLEPGTVSSPHATGNSDNVSSPTGGSNSISSAAPVDEQADQASAVTNNSTDMQDTDSTQDAVDTEDVADGQDATGTTVTETNPATDTAAAVDESTGPAATQPVAPVVGSAPTAPAASATQIDQNHVSLNYVPQQVPRTPSSTGTSSSTGATDGYPQNAAQAQHYEQQAKIDQSIQDTKTCTIGCVHVVDN